MNIIRQIEFYTVKTINPAINTVTLYFGYELNNAVFC